MNRCFLINIQYIAVFSFSEKCIVLLNWENLILLFCSFRNLIDDTIVYIVILINLHASLAKFTFCAILRLIRAM
jgi:hypothetical protein